MPATLRVKEQDEMPFEVNYCPIAISVAETARRLGIGRTTVYELIHSGQLKSTKVGRRRLISVASVHALMQQAA